MSHHKIDPKISGKRITQPGKRNTPIDLEKIEEEARLVREARERRKERKKLHKKWKEENK